MRRAVDRSRHSVLCSLMTNAKDLDAWKLGCVTLTLASSLQAGDFARQIE